MTDPEQGPNILAALPVLVSSCALLLSLLSVVLAGVAFARASKAMRLGVTFDIRGSNGALVVDGNRFWRGTVIAEPRGPGSRHEVLPNVWPPGIVEMVERPGGANKITDLFHTKPVRPGEVEAIKRWSAESDPIELHYKLVSATDAEPEEAWVGLTWDEPVLLGGFRPGGWRVLIRSMEGADRHQKWSRCRRRWVNVRAGKNPAKHPAYGSYLHPALDGAEDDHAL